MMVLGNSIVVCFQRLEEDKQRERERGKEREIEMCEVKGLMKASPLPRSACPFSACHFRLRCVFCHPIRRLFYAEVRVDALDI